MPKKATERTALEVGRLKAPGVYAVGGVAGLYLQVVESGARTWLLRATMGGKRRDMGLGGFPDVTLAQAREKARAARRRLEEGVDPIEERRQARSALAAARAASKTFEDCVEGFMKAKESEWRNPKHRQQWQNTLDTYAGPVMGQLLVGDVALAHVLKVLEPIWHEKTETATRVRGRIEQVLDWAKVRGYRKGDNPARWKGHLDQLLAKPRKISKVEHHAAVPVDAVGAFLVDLRSMDGMGARALEFAILTAARSGEVRGALWSEFDFAEKVWTVPGERMKGKVEHRVPLSKQAIELLETLPRFEKVEVVFPGVKGQVLSDMTLSAVMRRMKVDAVPHGFRSTFRDWAAERTNFPRDLAEMALAHVIESKVEAAYRRGDMLAKRLKMMQAWADYCDAIPKAGNVVPIKSA
ncbi:integrase [Variovorax boronicumulans]|uniref:tyrosine-type recombinase/integrase n=1 Tax=Variovorax boronicumulans TaxID=436515 RepID=UPI00277F85F6|nr:site-specific integrase [Variovorax boronicumulans]MDP9907945.1 integrase [Variovorax boronicumulans]